MYVDMPVRDFIISAGFAGRRGVGPYKITRIPPVCGPFVNGPYGV